MVMAMTFKEFIDKVKKTTTYKSKMHKMYQVMKASSSSFMLKDLRSKEEFTVQAQVVYNALQELGAENCTVSSLKTYVGAKAAPACSALIYYVAGAGEYKVSMKEMADLMKKILNSHEEEDITLDEILEGYHREELLMFASAFNLPYTEEQLCAMNKSLFISHLQERILLQTADWINDLPLHELKLLRLVVENGHAQFVMTPQMLAIEYLSLVDYEEHFINQHSINVWIYEDVRQAVAPYIDDAIALKEKNHEGIMEEALTGLLNIMGSITQREAQSVLQRLLPQYDKDITAASIELFMAHSIIPRITYAGNTEDGDKILYSDLIDAYDLQNSIKKDITPFSPTDIHEIIAHGTYPFLTPYRPCEKKFYDLFRQMACYNTEDAKQAYTSYYIQFQNPNIDLTQIISNIWSELVPNSSRDMEVAIAIIQEFNNDIPKFFLKGNSSSNSFESDMGDEMLSHISINLPGSMDEELMEEDDFYFLQPYIAEPKLGRNDLCPCGSGKKYKKCCGKKN